MLLTTFQVNLAPSDWRLASHLLSKQIAAWREQVDEVLLVLDFRRSAGRFADNWEEGRDKLLSLVEEQRGVRWVEVDYGRTAQKHLAEEWTGGRPIPFKDFRGGPSYSYFYGLSEAKGRYVLHSDADIFFGGLSRGWIAEALRLHDAAPDILFLGPLSGPPHPEKRIGTLPCTPDYRAPWGQRFDFISTRLFMIDRERFKDRIGAFCPKRPGLKDHIKAWIEGNPAWDLPEHWMTRTMRNAGMCRFEFLGTGRGMWSLHPPYRCEDFFKKLPTLVHMVESGQIPEAQLGCHDFNGSMVDWREATERMKRNRWWKRLVQRLAEIE